MIDALGIHREWTGKLDVLVDTVSLGLRVGKTVNLFPGFLPPSVPPSLHFGLKRSLLIGISEDQTS